MTTNMTTTEKLEECFKSFKSAISQNETIRNFFMIRIFLENDEYGLEKFYESKKIKTAIKAMNYFEKILASNFGDIEKSAEAKMRFEDAMENLLK